MKNTMATACMASAAIWLAAADAARANGGPFVVRYPEGDPAAKGVLARLDPSLKPARESRLRVVEERLTIAFQQDPFLRQNTLPPLADVTAAYTIENPTDEQIEVDFGFPILRGIYTHPMSMIPRPAVTVSVDGQGVAATVISNSVIYGVIREQARAVIEASIAADARLASLVGAIRGQAPQAKKAPAASDPEQARSELLSDLVGRLRWNERDAALLVEYCGVDIGQAKTHPPDRPHSAWQLGSGEEAALLLSSNLGPLAAIGEQKATQLFARLAGCFDPEAASTYEAIFAAWGGDVRSRSVDLATGQIRPREIELQDRAAGDSGAEMRLLWMVGDVDPTIYARVDYLDENANLTEAERAACKSVLKNLPVVFTFAPMNLLHYRVSFPARKTLVVAVNYQQYAYRDTRLPASYPTWPLLTARAMRRQLTILPPASMRPTSASLKTPPPWVRSPRRWRTNSSAAVIP